MGAPPPPRGVYKKGKGRKAYFRPIGCQARKPDKLKGLRPRWTGFLSECIYVNNMHEVRRVKPTISEIFMKMSLKIFCSASIIARDLYRVARTFCSLVK